MAQTVAEVMTRNPMTIQASAPVSEAAELMRDIDIGDVIVERDQGVVGILTDRDIVVRVVAQGRDAQTPVGEVCSQQDLQLVTPDTLVDRAVELMRERGVRRLPVVEGTRPVGIVSIGDLAIELDQHSALADISAAEPNL
jgi:CBS domain-containing protein